LTVNLLTVALTPTSALNMPRARSLGPFGEAFKAPAVRYDFGTQTLPRIGTFTQISGGFGGLPGLRGCGGRWWCLWRLGGCLNSCAYRRNLAECSSLRSAATLFG